MYPDKNGIAINVSKCSQMLLKFAKAFDLLHLLIDLNLYSSADPESFARGGPTLMGFFLVSFSLVRGRIQIPPLAGHHWPWRPDDGPTLNADLVAL